MSEPKSKTQAKTRAYRFALDIIKLVDGLSSERSAMLIGNQLIRSATSIGANIVEAQAGSSRRDFKNFLNHSLKSANETKYWLALLRDSGKKSEKEIDPLLIEATEIANILGASIITLNKK